MNIEDNHRSHPDLVFGPSDNNEGFMILHEGPRVTPGQKKSFDWVCRRLSWRATEQPPGKLHALLSYETADGLFLLHVGQKIDDKNRRALKVAGYLYDKTDHKGLLKAVHYLAGVNDIRLFNDLEKRFVSGNQPVLLSETDLLEIQNLRANRVPQTKKTRSKENKTSEKPRPPVSSKGNRFYITVIALVFGLAVGVAGAYYLGVKPIQNEIQAMQGELDASAYQVSELEDERNSLNRKNAKLSRELASAEQSVEDLRQEISDLKEDNSALRSNLSEEEKQVKDLMKNRKEREKIAQDMRERAEGMREGAQQLQSSAEKLDIIADELEPKSSWSLPKED